MPSYSSLFIIILIVCQAFTIKIVYADTKGFSLNATRIIYYETKEEALITVRNSDNKKSFLVQSWVTEETGKTKAPFLVMPPLYRQDYGQNTVRIKLIDNNLPKDRESLFWLNVKAIPSQKKEDVSNNAISFAYVMRLKLFYRPEGLNGTANEAFKKLKIKQNGNEVKITNPTPFYVTLNSMAFNGKQVNKDAPMLSPYGDYVHHLPEKTRVNEFSVRSVNDSGGVSDEFKYKLN
ncbi:fimbrial biogenesis chaperone [Pantoea dispersa]|uniref:fimbrial biogenesis chaperone n=1 Tax=Pantoea dispersa TaxID=59814 RepID=UPI002DB8AAD0|nr:molecular chaperone [Pantoea dispersa]MEB5974304.1 molecular chaperone [Pantoea dispersa]